MIWALSSRSSRGLTALTEPCVPTGMNAGVSMTPCAVVSWPRRAFVFLSLAFSSNIPGILKNSAVERQYSFKQMASNFSAAAGRRLMWQCCYWLALAAIFSWAAWQRFALPLDPLADPDTWGYLSPALRKLTGAEFGHTYGRNFVYPGFVFLILRAFGEFRAITLLQHLLGLTAGGFLLLTWRQARVFVVNPRLGHPRS